MNGNLVVCRQKIRLLVSLVSLVSFEEKRLTLKLSPFLFGKKDCRASTITSWGRRARLLQEWKYGKMRETRDDRSAYMDRVKNKKTLLFHANKIEFDEQLL